MKPARPIKYGIGWLILDCFLIVEIIIDVRTGKLTVHELCVVILVSLISAILLIKALKKRREKERKQIASTEVEDHTNPDNHTGH